MFYIYGLGSDQDPTGRECIKLPIIPSYETVRRLAGDAAVEGVAIMTVVKLPVDRIGSYHNNDVVRVFATYDGNTLWAETIDARVGGVATDAVLEAYTCVIDLMTLIAAGSITP